MDTAYSKVFPVHKGELWEVYGECLEVFYLHHDVAMGCLSCLVWQGTVLLQPEITLGRWVHLVQPLPLGLFPLPTREGSWAWDYVQPSYPAVFSFSARRSLSMKLCTTFVLRVIFSFHMRTWVWGYLLHSNLVLWPFSLSMQIYEANFVQLFHPLGRLFSDTKLFPTISPMWGPLWPKYVARCLHLMAENSCYPARLTHSLRLLLLCGGGFIWVWQA